MSDAPIGRGSAQRGGSVRRKLSPALGVGSPKAKKPALYVQPVHQPVPDGGYKMTLDQVANQVMQNKDAINALHAWITTVADASWDHAGMLDTAGNEIMLMKGKLAAQTVETKKQHDGAESLISNALVELKGIVDQLRAESTTTTAQLAARADQLEMGLRTLQSLPPPGPPGISPQHPGSVIGQEALAATVQVLGTRLEESANRVAQAAVEIRQLQATGATTADALAVVQG